MVGGETGKKVSMREAVYQSGGTLEEEQIWKFGSQYGAVSHGVPGQN